MVYCSDCVKHTTLHLIIVGGDSVNFNYLFKDRAVLKLGGVAALFFCSKTVQLVGRFCGGLKNVKRFQPSCFMHSLP